QGSFAVSHSMTSVSQMSAHQIGQLTHAIQMAAEGTGGGGGGGTPQWNIRTGDVTPRGREFTEHAAEQANARKYSPQDVDHILDNWTHKRYQPGGRSVYIYRSGVKTHHIVVMDKNGRTIISVIGGNTKNGASNTMLEWKDVIRMLENQGGYYTMPMY
ncbi:MAG: DUF4258 domain-containing protein, partial [Defluviitaleaceae bacterium]|nr:DUF4258 domain-containing protein [Defluviitaleaceae bacterium]